MNKFVKKTFFGLCVLGSFAPVLWAESLDANYSDFGQFLNQYVQNGLVNYQAVQKSPELLDEILRQLQNVKDDHYKSWQRDEQKAFWINAYNVAVIKTILDHYPLKKGVSWKTLVYPANSIQQIPDVWDQKAIKLLGKDRSLNEIEHEILRKEFKDPRIHFALVCASIGCPVLRPEPYLSNKLDSQLNDQVHVFLSDRRKAYYDKDSDTLHLSPVFRWFGKDFDESGGVIAFIKKYWPAAEEKWSVQTKIEWLDYDWSLNEKKE